jgi:hypothetical protein
MGVNKLMKIQRKHEADLLKKANVVSVGIGYKRKRNQITKTLSIIVGVAKKLEVGVLNNEDIVPTKIEGYATDVWQVGVIKPQVVEKVIVRVGQKRVKHFEKQYRQRLADAIAQGEFNTIGRHRPPMPGISIGHKNITAGTFGCVVEKDGIEYILSNNHVLANSNEGEIGDAIYQPGPYDGGTSDDTVATLHEFVPISFNGGGVLPDPDCGIAKTVANVCNAAAKVLGRSHRLAAYNPKALAEPNYVDAAIALPTVPISREIVEIGTPTGSAEAPLGTAIQKYGRTTQYTTGTIDQVNVTTNVSYGTNKIATFYGQLLSGPMSDGGDSGSAVLDMDKKVIGLLFAGSAQITIMNPIGEVLDAFGITIGT